MVVLRLGSITEKMIEVFRQKYQNSKPNALKLQVYDAKQDARQLRFIVSSSSVASYGTSILKMSQAPTILREKLKLPVDDAPPDWDKVHEWQSVDAHLYTYFIEDVDEPAKKSCKAFRALIAPKPFGKGAMRFAFHMVDEENPNRKYVGKVYQFDDIAFQQKSTYEGDMGSQAVASYLAKEFSLRYPESPIEFVPAQLLDLGASSAFPFRFMAVEPCIPGKYEKYTSNAGHITKDSHVAQAYSHYTWDFTSGELMVVDIQGVGNTLTDPQIHSLDTDRFGRGNLSCKGMDAFFMNHVCNDICRTLKLEPHPHQPGSAPHEPPQHLQSILEDEVQNDETLGGPELQVDWMPMPDSKLAAFLDAVRKDAEDLASHAASETESSSLGSKLASFLHGAVQNSGPQECSCLGGAVVCWKGEGGPQIIEVKKDSPAEKAGCESGVMLKLVGGQPVAQMPKQEILQLLAAKNNMILCVATVQKMQAMFERRKLQERRHGGLGALLALQELQSRLALDLDRHLSRASPWQGLRALVKELEEETSEEHKVEVQKHFFLDAVRDDAAKRVQTPEAADGWDEQRAVTCDTLAGATFAWTSPPQVTAIVPGSLADGLVSEGKLQGIRGNQCWFGVG